RERVQYLEVNQGGPVRVDVFLQEKVELLRGKGRRRHVAYLVQLIGEIALEVTKYFERLLAFLREREPYAEKKKEDTECGCRSAVHSIPIQPKIQVDKESIRRCRRPESRSANALSPTPEANKERNVRFFATIQ